MPPPPELRLPDGRYRLSLGRAGLPERPYLPGHLTLPPPIPPPPARIERSSDPPGWTPTRSPPPRARLPAMRPVDGPWLRIDARYGGATGREGAAAADRVTLVLARLAGSAGRAGSTNRGADRAAGQPGFNRTVRRCAVLTAVVPLDGDPLATIGALVQEDVCLLFNAGPSMFCIGGAACFPASWTLAEAWPAAGASMVPVASYDDGIARRVQRLFDGVQPGRPHVARRIVLRY